MFEKDEARVVNKAGLRPGTALLMLLIKDWPALPVNVGVIDGEIILVICDGLRLPPVKLSGLVLPIELL